MSKAGGVRQGGSTLTQQLAKTSFLSSDRSLKRKAQEVIIAFWLEGWLTKDEILSRYLSIGLFRRRRLWACAPPRAIISTGSRSG